MGALGDSDRESGHAAFEDRRVRRDGGLEVAGGSIPGPQGIDDQLGVRPRRVCQPALVDDGGERLRRHHRVSGKGQRATLGAWSRLDPHRDRLLQCLRPGRDRNVQVGSEIARGAQILPGQDTELVDEKGVEDGPLPRQLHRVTHRPGELVAFDDKAGVWTPSDLVLEGQSAGGRRLDPPCADLDLTIAGIGVIAFQLVLVLLPAIEVEPLPRGHSDDAVERVGRVPGVSREAHGSDARRVSVGAAGGRLGQCDGRGRAKLECMTEFVRPVVLVVEERAHLDVPEGEIVDDPQLTVVTQVLRQHDLDLVVEPPADRQSRARVEVAGDQARVESDGPTGVSLLRDPQIETDVTARRPEQLRRKES